MIFSRGNGGSTTGFGCGWVGGTGDNKLGYNWNDDLSAYQWDSGITIPQDTWVMLAVSVSASSATAYQLDAGSMSQATNTLAHSSTTLAQINLGRDPFGRYLNGHFDSLMLYNRALSAYELATLYDETRQGNPTLLRRVRPLSFGYRTATASSFQPAWAMGCNIVLGGVF